MLRIMAHQIQRSILKDICSSMWYCVSADETVDISLIEQVYVAVVVISVWLQHITLVSLLTAHNMHQISMSTYIGSL